MIKQLHVSCTSNPTKTILFFMLTCISWHYENRQSHRCVSGSKFDQNCAVGDWNPAGVSIASVYKSGSARMGLEAPRWGSYTHISLTLNPKPCNMHTAASTEKRLLPCCSL